MREPISRLLAGDGMVIGKYGLEEDRSIENWTKYFHNNVRTDNFNVRILCNYNTLTFNT